MKNKINSFADLVDKLYYLSKDILGILAGVNIDDYNANLIIPEPYSESVTFKTSVPFFTITNAPSFFHIYDLRNPNKFFSYDHKGDLIYHNTKNNKKIINRLILKNPTYDQIYEFLYYHFIHPLTLSLLNVKPSYLKVVNNIYKGRKIK